MSYVLCLKFNTGDKESRREVYSVVHVVFLSCYFKRWQYNINPYHTLVLLYFSTITLNSPQQHHTPPPPFSYSQLIHPKCQYFMIWVIFHFLTSLFFLVMGMGCDVGGGGLLFPYGCPK
jgi:hypothetical protein